MTWRVLNWFLWAAMILLLVLGSLRIIGQHYIWMAALLATVVEMVAMAFKDTKPTTSRAPVPLTDEMVRTQDHAYQRAVRGLKTGVPVQYGQLRLQVVRDSFECDVTPEEPDWDENPAGDREWAVRGELERAQASVERLRRAAPEIDDLARDRRLVLTLYAPGSRKRLGQLVDGQLEWVGGGPSNRPDAS